MLPLPPQSHLFPSQVAQVFINSDGLEGIINKVQLPPYQAQSKFDFSNILVFIITSAGATSESRKVDLSSSVESTKVGNSGAILCF